MSNEEREKSVAVRYVCMYVGCGRPRLAGWVLARWLVDFFWRAQSLEDHSQQICDGMGFTTEEMGMYVYCVLYCVLYCILYIVHSICIL